MHLLLFLFLHFNIIFIFKENRNNIGIMFNDRDADGMVDEWEVEFGLNPANASDAMVDTDSDGVINLDEFLAGTDPNNPTDRFIFLPYKLNNSSP